MKLIFINPLPTSKLFGEKVNAWWYSKNGLDTEFWDISPIFWSESRLENYYGGKSDYRYLGPGHREFKNNIEVINALSDLPNDTVVFYLGRFYPLVEDDWIFSVMDCQGISYYLQHYDTRIESPHIFQRLRHRLGNFKNRLRNRNIFPKGVIGSGRLGRKQSYSLFPNARFISIPSFKIEWQEMPRVYHGQYNLFVDESIDYAPDAKMLGYDICHDPDGYYGRLNDFFECIEQWSGCPVVVAASGKYQYERDRFHGRKVIYGETLSLIQNADFVIGHMSLALDQCLVSVKPILTIDDPGFTRIKRRGFSNSLVNLLKGPQLVNKVTHSIYTQALNPNFEIVQTLVRDYLKEDEVDSDHYTIVKNEVLATANAVC